MPPDATRVMRWPEAMTDGMERDLGTLKAEHRRVIVETQATRSELARLLRPAAKEAAEADMTEAALAYRAGKPLPPPKHSDANAAKVKETERRLETLGRALLLVERDVLALLHSNREAYASQIAAERAACLDTARQAMDTLSTSLARVGGLDSASRWLAGGKMGTADPLARVGGRVVRLSQVLAGTSAALAALTGEERADVAA